MVDPFVHRFVHRGGGERSAMMVPRGDGNECARRAPEPTGALRRTVRQNLLNQPGRVWVGFGPQIAGPRDCGADYPRDWRVQAVPG